MGDQSPDGPGAPNICPRCQTTLLPAAKYCPMCCIRLRDAKANDGWKSAGRLVGRLVRQHPAASSALAALAIIVVLGMLLALLPTVDQLTRSDVTPELPPRVGESAGGTPSRQVSTGTEQLPDHIGEVRLGMTEAEVAAANRTTTEGNDSPHATVRRDEYEYVGDKLYRIRFSVEWQGPGRPILDDAIRRFGEPTEHTHGLGPEAFVNPNLPDYAKDIDHTLIWRDAQRELIWEYQSRGRLEEFFRGSLTDLNLLKTKEEADRQQRDGGYRRAEEEGRQALQNSLKQLY